MPTLTWTGKEDALRAASLVPFRLLEPHTAVPGGIVGDPKAAQDNLLIQGDNLEALKALLPYYAGRVKCIYIDPPYNTGSAFEHYDDNLEHSTWLSMMYPRLELLRELLAEEGSLWVNLDDNEAHYAKILLDEVFGRTEFVVNGIWQKAYSVRMDSKGFSFDHDHVLVYQKSSKFVVKKLEIEQQGSQFSYFDSKKQQYYRRRSLRKEGSNSLRSDRPNLFYPLQTPDGSDLLPVKPDGTEGYWRWSKDTYHDELNKDPDILEWVKKDTGWQVYVKQFKEDNALRPPSSVWNSSEVGHNHEAKEEAKVFNRNDVFATPKPERLIKYILDIATDPGDLILDSFLGSGTTAAVAHKMGRRWIGVEMGDHAVTHCLPRLQKVIEGERGGISESVGWKGGGGFRFVKLGETLFDAFGRLNPKVRFADLAAFIWWREAKAPAIAGSIKTTSPFLGIHEGRGLYLLYNGILGDKRPKGGNVLTPTILASLPKHDGARVIYAEATTYSPSSLARMNITFKQIPYDLGSMPLLAEGALEYAAGLMPEAPLEPGARSGGANEEGEHV
jgi:adenine-specific DNA-methyltransferase